MIGLGTVGTGTLRILRENAEVIQRRVGIPVEVTKVAVRDLKRDRGIAIPDGLLTTDPSEIVKDPDIDIVVELIGGYEPAKELILSAIARGKQPARNHRAGVRAGRHRHLR